MEDGDGLVSLHGGHGAVQPHVGEALLVQQRLLDREERGEPRHHHDLVIGLVSPDPHHLLQHGINLVPGDLDLDVLYVGEGGVLLLLLALLGLLVTGLGQGRPPAERAGGRLHCGDHSLDTALGEGGGGARAAMEASGKEKQKVENRSKWSSI